MKRRVFHPRSRGLACGFAALAMLAGAEAAEKRKPAVAKPNPPAVKPAPAVPASPTVPTNPMPADEASRKEAQAQHDAGLNALERGDLTSAKLAFQKALTASPGNVPALLNLALVEQRLQDYGEAERHLRQVLRNDPENATAWLVLGIAAYDQNKLEAAHAHLAQAVLYAPKNAQAHQFLGVVLGRKGWYSAGEEELRRAVELDPKFADAHYNLAVLYMERVPPAIELARRHYERSLELGARPDAELARKLDAEAPRKPEAP
jgi:tetratricopeptide (TPR) repeat protein